MRLTKEKGYALMTFIHSFMEMQGKDSKFIYQRILLASPPQISKDDHKDTFIKTGEVT